MFDTPKLASGLFIGYVGMLGTKLPQDQGDLAYPFSNRSWNSVHPMPDMFLIRSRGGADRYLLQPYDGGKRNNNGVEEHWYAYKPVSSENHTEVYYCDRPPYQNSNMSFDVSVNDYNDYYLVKEPDGTWAKFGAGNTKGVEVQTPGNDGLYEEYWALPNSIHHFSGDSITIDRDYNLNISGVSHSRDPRWVGIIRTGTVETDKVFDKKGQVLSSQEIQWGSQNFPVKKNTEQVNVQVDMPVAVTVPVDATKKLTTSFGWNQGNLSEIERPDGSKEQFDWYSSNSGLQNVLDGFLHRCVHFSRNDGSGAKVEYLFTHNGWNNSDGSGQGAKEGSQQGILYTNLTKTMTTPSPEGGNVTSSTSSRYRFQYRQEQVNIRNKLSDTMTFDPDTNIKNYSSVMTERLQLLTAWEGIEGTGVRTDYAWNGDQLLMKFVRPGIDTVFAPKLEVYSYDAHGSLATRQINPADKMEKMEWMTLVSLSGLGGSKTIDTSIFTIDSLSARVSSAIGKQWKSRFDTLDLTEISSWHHETESELLRDTAYMAPNPTRATDSASWVTVNQAAVSLTQRITQYSSDSLCASVYGNINKTCQFNDTPTVRGILYSSRLFEAVPDLMKRYDSLYCDTLKQILAGARAQLSLLSDSASTKYTAWNAEPESVVVHWTKRNPNFDPYGRYISIPFGKWVTRKNYGASWDSTIHGCGIIGSRTVYDSALLRPMRTDIYQNGWLPGTRMEYGSDQWPYAATGVRTYVDSVGSNLRYRYASSTLDGLGSPIETHAWKALFSESKSDGGLPAALPVAPSVPSKPDFVTTLARDYRERVTKTVDPRGGVSEAQYDLLNRVVKSHVPGGAWSTTTYADVQDANGIVWTTSTRETGVKDISGADGLGNSVISGVVSSDGKDSVLSRQGYGVHGPMWSLDPEGRKAVYSYDARGRRIWTTIPKPDGSAYTWQTVWDDLNRTSTETDPLGQQTVTTFDVAGNPIQVDRLVAGKTWSIKSHYDNLGNLVWSQAPGGDTTHNDYDLANLLSHTATAQGLEAWNLYNWTSDPIWTARRGSGSGLDGASSGGDTSTMEYDGLGRLVTASVLNDARLSQSLQYDGQNGTLDPGMLLGVSRGNGAVSSLRYDVRGSMTSRQLVSGLRQELSDSLSWSYLADGRPQSQSLPRGAKIVYGWDKLDRIGKVSFQDPKGGMHVVLDTLIYRKDGQLDSLHMGNGIGERYAYDTVRGLLTGVSVFAKSGRQLMSRTDSFDAAGRLYARTRGDGQYVYYGYDSLDRLSSVRYGSGNSSSPNYRYGWNSEGARTSFVHDYGQSSWSLGGNGASNQALSSQGTHDGYSAWGWDWKDALSVRRWQMSATDTGLREERRYGWNRADELERFRRVQHLGDRQDTILLAQSFGDHGLRTGKYRGKANGSDTTWSLAHRSVWDGSDVLADSTADDSGWRYRIPFGLNAIAEANLDSSGSWALTYVVSDPVGTPELLLDDTGSVVGRYAYGPFGELEDYQGSRTVDFLYGGREWDGDLEAGVFGYRLYDPEMGQFLSTDPMDQYWNPYSYTGASPLDMADPWGLADEPQYVEGSGASKTIVVMGHTTCSDFSGATNASFAGNAESGYSMSIAMSMSNYYSEMSSLAAAKRGSEMDMIKNGMPIPNGTDNSVFFAPAIGGTLRMALNGVGKILSIALESRNASAISGILSSGSGPEAGVISVNARSKSIAALRRYLPKMGRNEFVYDPSTETFAVGRPKLSFPGLSPHQNLARSIAADEAQVLGGTFSRSESGEFLTNEFSGHYGARWTDAARENFMSTMSNYGLMVKHTKW